MKTLNESLNECLFFTAKKLDRILDKVAEDAFKPTGLSPTYGFIILAVAETPGIAQKDLAELLQTAPSTIARFVQKLELQRYIYTEQAGRNTLAYLTEEGNKLAIEVNKSWDKLHDTFCRILGEDAHDVLAKQVNDAGTLLRDRK